MQSFSFNASPIIRTKMLRDSSAMVKASNLITKALNAALFPVRFECQIHFNNEGLRATVTGSEHFDPLEVQRALFGTQKEEGALFGCQ